MRLRKIRLKEESEKEDNTKLTFDPETELYFRKNADVKAAKIGGLKVKEETTVLVSIASLLP